MVNSYIALGYKCNHNCINCPLSTYDRLHGQLDSNIIKKHIVDLSNNENDLHVTISGGEPTINKDFIKVLELLGKANAYITILSNATTCKNDDFVKKMIESLGPDYDFNRFHYVTAIHSYIDQIHDQFTGTQNSYNETMEGLNNLINHNINVIIKHIMNGLSAPTMAETLDYLCRYFPNNVDFEFCSMDYSGRCAKYLKELYISFENLEPYLEETLDTFERNKDNCGKNLKIFETPLCLVDPYYWKYYKFSEREGLTYIAPNDESIDSRSENVESKCHTNYQECSTCDVKEYCDGIWQSMYNIEKGKNARPVKVLKRN